MHGSTSIHGAFQSMHGSQEPARVRQMLVNDAYIHTYPQLFRAGAVVMINVGHAHAHPNNSI